MPNSSVVWTILAVLLILAVLVWLFRNLGGGDADAALAAVAGMPLFRKFAPFDN